MCECAIKSLRAEARNSNKFIHKTENMDKPDWELLANHLNTNIIIYQHGNEKLNFSHKGKNVLMDPLVILIEGGCVKILYTKEQAAVLADSNMILN